MRKSLAKHKKKFLFVAHLHISKPFFTFAPTKLSRVCAYIYILLEDPPPTPPVREGRGLRVVSYTLQYYYYFFFCVTLYTGRPHCAAAPPLREGLGVGLSQSVRSAQYGLPLFTGSTGQRPRPPMQRAESGRRQSCVPFWTS